jgi:hypothetical protein
MVRSQTSQTTTASGQPWRRDSLRRIFEPTIPQNNAGTRSSRRSRKWCLFPERCVALWTRGDRGRWRMWWSSCNSSRSGEPTASGSRRRPDSCSLPERSAPCRPDTWRPCAIFWRLPRRPCTIFWRLPLQALADVSRSQNRKRRTPPGPTTIDRGVGVVVGALAERYLKRLSPKDQRRRTLLEQRDLK